MKVQRIVAEETSCETELSNDVVIHGYSEGGYGSLAIAKAMQSYGANVVRVNAGGGPYMMASAQVRNCQVSARLIATDLKSPPN